MEPQTDKTQAQQAPEGTVQVCLSVISMIVTEEGGEASDDDGPERFCDPTVSVTGSSVTL